MSNIINCLILATADKAVIEGAVEAVLLAFTVVVGVALERFLKDHEIVEKQNYKGWQRELFYWSVLTILITLSIRFLVGSYTHLHATYTETPTFKNYLRFLKDLFFLFAFGAFLVRAALAQWPRDFARWLMLFSGTGLLWSLTEVITRRTHLAWGWLVINLLQFAGTFMCWQSFIKEAPTADPKITEQNTRRNLGVFAGLLLFFIVLFCVDLWQIIIGFGANSRESIIDNSFSVSVHEPDWPRNQSIWSFAVSGDSRNCGDVVMPTIARSVQDRGAEFYWHLGDLRAFYNFDEDMFAAQHKKHTTDPEQYELSIPDYQAKAWDNVIDQQIEPFGSMPFFLGIGNHELVAPKTRSEFVSKFTDWLDQPLLHDQRHTDNSRDHAVHTYYHWVREGIDFIYIDNASDTIDDLQMNWIRSILIRAEIAPEIRAVVVGMHEALPESLARSHSMSDNEQGEKTGLEVYRRLLNVSKKGKPVYIFASHSHFYMADVFNTEYWRSHGGVLPGWIVGSAGAERYELPKGVEPSEKAQTDVYGYLLVTVHQDGNPRIATKFVKVKEKEVPDQVADRYLPGFVHWCFVNNSKTHASLPPP